MPITNIPKTLAALKKALEEESFRDKDSRHAIKEAVNALAKRWDYMTIEEADEYNELVDEYNSKMSDFQAYRVMEKIEKYIEDGKKTTDSGKNILEILTHYNKEWYENEDVEDYIKEKIAEVVEKWNVARRASKEKKKNKKS